MGKTLTYPCAYPPLSPGKKEQLLWRTGGKILACWPQPHGGAYADLLLLWPRKRPGQPSLQEGALCCVVQNPRTGEEGVASEMKCVHDSSSAGNCSPFISSC